MAASTVPAFGPIKVPAFGPLTSTRIRTLGVIGLLFTAQWFVWLSTVVNTNSSGDSTVFGGNWSVYNDPMLFYLIGMLFAMVLVNYVSDVSVVPKAKDISRFLINYSMWTFVTWGILSLIFPNGAGAAPLTGMARFQNLVFVSLFVAPTEELLFRVVLPRVLNSWILGSVVAFTLFHLSAYTLSYNGPSLIAGFISLMLLGVILWLVYSFQIRIRTKRYGTVVINSGYGGSTGLHAAYDLFVLGVLAPLLGSGMMMI